MATLNSPGVQVQVINESFYTPAAPGTIPLIFVASASNKSNSSGTGTATGTLDGNAGQIYLTTSQRDLVDYFGTPYFETDASGNPVNGGELNEYGLQAAYSLLGVSSQAYIARANVDLGMLEPSISVPGGMPVAGTYWVDTQNSVYGISVWDNVNKVFNNITPLIVDDSTAASYAPYDSGSGFNIPASTFGTVGSYAMVVTSQNTNCLWYKNWNKWVKVGSNKEGNFTAGNNFQSTCWQTSIPVAVSSGFNNGSITGVTIKVNGLPANVTVSGTGATDFCSSFNSVLNGHGVNARVLPDGKTVALYADVTSSSTNGTPDGGVSLLAVTPNALQILGFASGTTTSVTFPAVAIAVQPHTRVPAFSTNGNATGSVWIKTTTPNSGANWSLKLYNGTTETWGTVTAPLYDNNQNAIYALDKSGGQLIPAGTLYVEYNYGHGTGSSATDQLLATFQVKRRNITGPTTISYVIPTTFTAFAAGSFQIKETLPSGGYSGNYTVNIGVGQPGDFVTAVNLSGLQYVSASFDSITNTISLTHSLGGDFMFIETSGLPLTGGGNTALQFSAYNMSDKSGTANLYATGLFEPGGYANNGTATPNPDGLVASNWKPLVYQALQSSPTTVPATGQLWFNPTITDVDILYHNGTTWIGYKSSGSPFATSGTDPNGPIISATMPTKQSDGVTTLKNGDIWISTANMEKFGKMIYVYSNVTNSWVLQDVTDHVSPNGWLFADARWSTAGANSTAAPIKNLLTSNYLDPDAPDPALYPAGTRLWNTRRSGFNVKRYVQNYIDINSNGGKNPRYSVNGTGDVMNSGSPYFTDRWVTASPNDDFGVGTFGRHSQRSCIVAAFKSLIDTDTGIRDTDTLLFNLIACPGYPELISNMINLNNDRHQTAFVVGDTPFRLPANATALAAYGNNTNRALDNGDTGLVSYDNYTAVYYPSGYTNDNLGNNIVVPPSHMMLRTIARSDSVSYPWFAPAGLRRGTVDNATSVGYVDSVTGEFIQASLYESLRDAMALNGHINPIATLPGSGLTVMAEYTRANVSSALDRVGVARLVCYLRRQLEILSRPFLFEPNDKITRDELKAAADSLLLELVGQRALYDFIVVCDESNNTPARIDRNELWMDIAIEPVKSVEFIYIPLRLVNTGAIQAGKL